MKESVFRELYLSTFYSYVSKSLRYYQRYDEFNKIKFFKVLEYYEKVFNEVYDNYFNQNTNNISMRYREWTSLMHRYFKQARKEENHDLLYALFCLWNDAREFFPSSETNFTLNIYNKYTRLANDSEKLLALSDNLHEYDDNILVLTYRNINAIIDKWGVAHLFKNGKIIRSFSLEWDWWFPIDLYLDVDRYEYPEFEEVEWVND